MTRARRERERERERERLLQLGTHGGSTGAKAARALQNKNKKTNMKNKIKKT